MRLSGYLRHERLPFLPLPPVQDQQALAEMGCEGEEEATEVLGGGEQPLNTSVGELTDGRRGGRRFSHKINPME